MIDRLPLLLSRYSFILKHSNNVHCLPKKYNKVMVKLPDSRLQKGSHNDCWVSQRFYTVRHPSNVATKNVCVAGSYFSSSYCSNYRVNGAG